MVLEEAASQLGIPIWLMLIALVWTLIWKALSLWKAARLGHKVWFVVLLVVSSIGLIEVLYYFVFSELKFEKNIRKNLKRRR